MPIWIVDPCSFYTELKDITRIAQASHGAQLLCDRDLLKHNNYTWYRFNNGPSSQMMPTDPVKMIHCGTISPGWLKRIHPTGNNLFVLQLTVATIDFIW